LCFCFEGKYFARRRGDATKSAIGLVVRCVFASKENISRGDAATLREAQQVSAWRRRAVARNLFCEHERIQKLKTLFNPALASFAS
jgi:hypothetical protein